MLVMQVAQGRRHEGHQGKSRDNDSDNKNME